MIDLRRNVIFGQYLDCPSPIHRLDPRFKVVIAVLLTITTFLLRTGEGFVLLLPPVLLVTAVAHVPLSFLLRGSRFFLIALAVILLFSVVFYPGGGVALVRLGPLPLRLEGLEAAAILAARVLLLYWATTMLMLTTQLVDLTDGIETLFAPLRRVGVPVNELVLVGVIALKFVPIFTAEAERLALARAARGMPLFVGGPIGRARRLGSLLVPIFVSGFRRADALTVAMDARCYRGGRYRTKWRRLHAGGRDWVALALTLLLCGVVLWVSRVGG